MLSIYLAALGFGSSLILVSLFFGGGDKDFDKDVDVDHDVDVDVDADADIDHDLDAEAEAELEVDKDVDLAGHAAQGMESGSEALWIPFLSMRFWTFGMATFGLAGTLLTLLSVSWWLSLAVSVLVGVGLGIGAAWFFRQLKRDTVSGDTTLSRFAGEEARVLLTVRPGGQGKIVVETLAGRVEMLASTRDREAIERGSTVIIAQVRGGGADVSYLPDTPAGSQAQHTRAAQAQQRASKERSGV